MTTTFAQADLERRFVRYGALRPCTTAFIDSRTPGSEHKENFTIIGPGVAENPDQHVHIDLPHGFNVGGARQPPRCVNSQHSHETAEVFIVHTGVWRFKTGHDGRDGYVDLGPGDTISIPTRVFRGFENIGDSPGFLFAVLGGDDPGRVTWAPYVFNSARRYGLVLLESGRLIDTTCESVPEGATPMRPTTMEDVARFDTYGCDAIAACTVKRTGLSASGGLSELTGFAECPIVGVANEAERMPAGRMGWSHGFQVRALLVQPGAASPAHLRVEEEVLLMHEGRLAVECGDARVELAPGDILTLPKHVARTVSNPGATPAMAYVVRGGDHPQAAHWLAPLERAG